MKRPSYIINTLIKSLFFHSIKYFAEIAFAAIQRSHSKAYISTSAALDVHDHFFIGQGYNFRNLCIHFRRSKGKVEHVGRLAFTSYRVNHIGSYLGVQSSAIGSSRLAVASDLNIETDL